MPFNLNMSISQHWGYYMIHSDTVLMSSKNCRTDPQHWPTRRVGWSMLGDAWHNQQGFQYPGIYQPTRVSISRGWCLASPTRVSVSRHLTTDNNNAGIPRMMATIGACPVGFQRSRQFWYPKSIRYRLIFHWFRWLRLPSIVNSGLFWLGFGVTWSNMVDNRWF